MTNNVDTNKEPRSRHFYQNEHMATHHSTRGNRHTLWGQGTPIAQLGQPQGVRLLQIDQANSVIGMPPEVLTYSPYGHLELRETLGLIAFNGQWLDPAIDGYMLGNGHRLVKTGLSRFTSPDALSPFDRGGNNSYVYCAGDPINKVDPSGRSFSLLKWVRQKYGYEHLYKRAAGTITTEEDAKKYSFSSNERRAWKSHYNDLIDQNNSNLSKYEARTRPNHAWKSEVPASPSDREKLGRAQLLQSQLEAERNVMKHQIVIDGKTRYTTAKNQRIFERLLNNNRIEIEPPELTQQNNSVRKDTPNH